MKFIKLYNFEVLGKRLLKIFLIMCGLFIASAFLTQLFLKYNPSTIPNFKEISSELVKSLGVLNGTSVKFFTDIFLTNLRVSIVVIIIGLIPNLYLSAWLPIYNGIVIGLIFAAIEIKKKSILLYILLGLVPHGIFEMAALLYATSIGIYFTRHVSISKKNGNKIYLKSIIPELLKTYVLIIIPLLIIAALIETYITPELLTFYKWY